MQHYRTVCSVRNVPELATEERKKKNKRVKEKLLKSLPRHRTGYTTLMTSFGFLCEAFGVQLRASLTESALLQKCFCVCLTFGCVNHLRIHCRGDDRQGKILQIPAQTITQSWEL